MGRGEGEDPTRPWITVVIPFLNGDNFLREAVASVFEQQPGGWELILVDDGSTDASAEYARTLALTDPRVRLMAHPGGANLGTAQSRKLGLTGARADYVLFLDHDDLLLPGALEKMTAVLDRHPSAGALFAGTIHRPIDGPAGVGDTLFDFCPYPSGIVPRRSLLRDMVRSDRRHPAAGSTLFRRSALLSSLAKTQEFDAPIYEDSAVALALLADHDVYLLNEPISIYRIHGRSKSALALSGGTYQDTPWCEDRLAFLRWAKEALALPAADRLYVAAVTAALPLIGHMVAAGRLLPQPARRMLRAIVRPNSG